MKRNIVLIALLSGFVCMLHAADDQSDDHMTKALMFEQQRNYQDALTHYMQVDSKDCHLMYRIGFLCKRMNQLEAAYYWFNAASEKGHPVAELNRNKLQARMKERSLKKQVFGNPAISGLREQLRKTMKKDPVSLDALYELGCMYEKRKKDEHADLAFELAAETGHVGSLMQLGVCDRDPWEYGIDPRELGLAMHVYHLECEGTL